MKAARVTSWDSPPEEILVPDIPAPTSSEMQLKIVAAGVSRAVRGRAACKHPSAFNVPLPFDPSVDGVGRDETTGDLYYVSSLAAPVFAERANVPRDELVKLGAEADPITVAALSNPAASSWMALQCRVVGGCKGRTVVILGATSASGRAAVPIARALGAIRIVGVSRNEATLQTVEGLDDRVVLKSPFVWPESIGPVHIVLDWIGGPAAVDLMREAQIEPGENLQYVQTGGLAGYGDIVIPARLINIKPILVMASGVGSLSKDDLKREMKGLVEALTRMRKPPFEVFTASLAEVKSMWKSSETENTRLVITP